MGAMIHHRQAGDSWPSTLSARDVATVLFKRRALILTVAGSVLILVAAITMLLPPSYETVATLLVNKSRAQVPLTAGDLGPLLSVEVTQQELNSEIEILRSRELTEATLRALDGQGQRPAKRRAPISRALDRVLGTDPGAEWDRLVLELQGDLEVSGVRRSNVIRVAYRATDADWATQVVATLIELYLDRRSDIQQSVRAVSFFAQQMQQAEQALAEREENLRRFQATAGVTMVRGPEGSDSLEAQKRLLLERLARLENQLADARTAIEEGEHRVATLGRRLTSQPERLRTADRLHHAAASEELETTLARLKLERDALLQEYHEESRYVRDVDEQIRLATQRLAEFRRDAEGIDGTELNRVHQDLLTELSRAEADLEGYRGRVSSLQQSLVGHRKELHNLTETAGELESLRRDARLAEEVYLLYRKKHEEARIAAAMDQQRLINVAVAQPARRPLRPVAPNRLRNLVAGLVLGSVGGLLLAFVAELYFDHRFTAGAEVERRLGIWHVASIPEER